MVSGPVRLSGAGALLPLAGVIGLCGCASPEDRRFRAAVGAVLKQCAELHAQVGVFRSPEFVQAEIRMSDEGLQAEWTAASEAIERFRAAVVALPQPMDKRLRYLAIRLGALGGSANVMVAAHFSYLDTLRNLRSSEVRPIERRLAYERNISRCSESIERYGKSLLYVVAAEQVALRTSTVRDALDASYLGSRMPTPQIRARTDSLCVATERLVRSEIGTMR